MACGIEANEAGMDQKAFGQPAQRDLAACYPRMPARLAHDIADHPLLTLDAMAALAARMRPSSLGHNGAVNLPMGVSNADLPGNGLTVHETIAQIADCGSWVLLLNIEQDPAYARLLHDVLGEIAPIVEPQTGNMLRLEGFVFISSPLAITPLHFDPEYNILFQAHGSKTMTLFPTADPDIIGQPFFEQYYNGGPRNLPWREEWAARGREISVVPGEAISIPVHAPHWVRVHDEVSISLSLTWRSEWVLHHADACRFNRRLRLRGLQPAAVRIYPRSNQVKSYAHRALARLERRLGKE
ncbi:MAG: transcriptional regulator [Novosphingobium sp.]